MVVGVTHPDAQGNQFLFRHFGSSILTHGQLSSYFTPLTMARSQVPGLLCLAALMGLMARQLGQAFVGAGTRTEPRMALKAEGRL